MKQSRGMIKCYKLVHARGNPLEERSRLAQCTEGVDHHFGMKCGAPVRAGTLQVDYLQTLIRCFITHWHPCVQRVTVQPTPLPAAEQNFVGWDA